MLFVLSIIGVVLFFLIMSISVKICNNILDNKIAMQHAYEAQFNSLYGNPKNIIETDNDE